MKINADGRVTIPKAMREELGLLPHTEVKLVVVADGVRVVIVEQKPKTEQRRSD